MSTSNRATEGHPVGQLVIGVVLVLGSLGVLLYNVKWIASVLRGPTPITAEKLGKLRSPSDLSNQWVSLKFDKATDTGVGYTETRGGTTTPMSKFVLIPVQNRWLIAELPVSHSGNTVSGYLDTWWAPLRKKAIDSIKNKYPKHDFLPFQIDAEYDQRGQCYAMMGVLGFFLVCGVGLGAMGAVNLTRSQPRRRYRRGA